MQLCVLTFPFFTFDGFIAKYFMNVVTASNSRKKQEQMINLTSYFMLLFITNTTGTHS